MQKRKRKESEHITTENQKTTKGEREENRNKGTTKLPEINE